MPSLEIWIPNSRELYRSQEQKKTAGNILLPAAFLYGEALRSSSSYISGAMSRSVLPRNRCISGRDP